MINNYTIKKWLDFEKLEKRVLDHIKEREKETHNTILGYENQKEILTKQRIQSILDPKFDKKNNNFSSGNAFIEINEINSKIEELKKNLIFEKNSIMKVLEIREIEITEKVLEKQINEVLEIKK